MNTEVKRTFTPGPIVSYRSSGKLCSYLLRAKLYPMDRLVGSKGYSEKRCDVLHNVSEKILSILKGLNTSKAAGIDNLSGKFLKDDTHILARPISQLCNLSIKLNSFPRSCKIAKAKPLFKKGSKINP